jgi:hypothetical protein
MSQPTQAFGGRNGSQRILDALTRDMAAAAAHRVRAIEHH